MKPIPQHVLSPIVGLLRHYMPDLTESALAEGLERRAAGSHAAPSPEALTRDEVCRAGRISESTLGRLIRSGRLPVIRIGRAVRIPRSAVEELLGSAPETQAGPAGPEVQGKGV